MSAFLLLALAIAAVWLPPVRDRGAALPVWPLVFAAAVIAACLDGVLTVAAWPGLAAFAAVTWAAAASPSARPAFTLLSGGLGLALAVHLLPGFHNPRLFDAVVLSPGAAPFTQALNFDKAAAGLFLLAAFAPRLQGWRDARACAVPAALAALATASLVMGMAWAAGVVRWDPKWVDAAPAFLAVNLLFTCVAEEAFFRGLLQHRLPGPRSVAAGASALLFGAVHLPAGVLHAGLATLVGLGCAAVFERTRRIEAAVAVHFAVNAVHFLFFTYPAAAMK